jgi:nicotinamide riboside kinase
VLWIAKKQLNQYQENLNQDKIVFFDTWLIITKIWLKVVYDCHENWIDAAIRNSKIDLYILCDIDIPWEADEVRENGGEMRERLFALYRDVLEDNDLNYRIIRGIGPDRINNAIFTLENFTNQNLN